jgi:phosphatidate cytidylyltransferase
MDVFLPLKTTTQSMLGKRVLVSLILLPIGAFVIIQGGLLFNGLISLIIGMAALEFTQIFRAGGYQPSGAFVIGGSVILVLARVLTGFESAHWLLALIILGSMAYHVLAYERGSERSGSDFGITLAGVFYLGWIGAYFISLRQLPDGQWWFITAVLSVMAADSAAYWAGHRFGKHKFSPRVSPNKTWEGYLGGVVGGMVGGAALAALSRLLGGPEISVTIQAGAVIGLILGVLTPIGDLGESLFKRQLGVKDSGSLLPGHGGVFDRIDSWLWACVLGYYLISTFFVA